MDIFGIRVSRINVSDSVFTIEDGSIDGDGNGFGLIGYVTREIDSNETKRKPFFYTDDLRKLPSRID